ncbi:bacteriocin-like protein [Chryseobacterium sediminis]|uniref:bacteriocin-like protein n=1 Tax=Chryseobacterium sediminis TaxID=1679494 RepID=UPI00389965F7
MKNLKKINRNDLKSVNGGIGPCYENCPAGPYGPGEPRSCTDYHALPECCKGRVLVSIECFDRP